MPARLYLDEDVYRGVALGLRRRGFDVLTTSDAGNGGRSDEEQLRFAIANGRCLFTFNRGDFVRLHSELIGTGEHHFGIVLAPQARIGAVVRALAQLLSVRSEEELTDQLLWLRIQDSEPA